jgi:hypothetical protein
LNNPEKTTDQTIIIYFKMMNAFKTIFTPIILASSLLLAACPGPNKQDLGSREELLAKQADAEKAKEIRDSTENCKNTIGPTRDLHARFIKAKDYLNASTTISPCAELLNDPELKLLAKDALLKSYSQEFYGPKTSIDRINAAADWIKENYPEEKSKIDSNLAKVTAAAKKRDEAATRKDIEEAKQLIRKMAAVQKAAGVNIGMSMEQVRASSWGRQNSINRTTTAYGDREQWVYGIGNYLYFENGVLTTIQN